MSMFIGLLVMLLSLMIDFCVSCSRLWIVIFVWLSFMVILIGMLRIILMLLCVEFVVVFDSGWNMLVFVVLVVIGCWFCLVSVVV